MPSGAQKKLSLDKPSSGDNAGICLGLFCGFVGLMLGLCWGCVGDLEGFWWYGSQVEAVASKAVSLGFQ